MAKLMTRLVGVLAAAVLSLGVTSGFGVETAHASSATDGADSVRHSALPTVISEELEADFREAGIDPNDEDFQREYTAVIEQFNKATEKIPLEVAFSYTARGDGCSFSPDRWGAANFRPACDHHDSCYSSGSRTNRSVCDKHFLGRLRAICDAAYPNNSIKRNGCRGIAAGYYAVVRSAGWNFYEGKGKND